MAVNPNCFYVLREKKTGKIIAHGSEQNLIDMLGMPRGKLRYFINDLLACGSDYYRIEKYKIRNHYTVYRRINDEIIAAGTAEECAKTLGYAPNGFYCAYIKSKNGRLKKYEIFCDEMTDEEFWEEYQNGQIYQCG